MLKKNVLCVSMANGCLYYLHWHLPLFLLLTLSFISFPLLLCSSSESHLYCFLRFNPRGSRTHAASPKWQQSILITGAWLLWEEPIKVLLRRRAIITALHGPKTWSLSLANDWKLRDKMTVQKTLIQTLRGPGTQLLDEDSPSGDWRLSRSLPLTGTLFNHSAVYREGDENDSVWHLREAYHYFREKLWNKKDRPFRGPFVETGSMSKDIT